MGANAPPPPRAKKVHLERANCELAKKRTPTYAAFHCVENISEVVDDL